MIFALQISPFVMRKRTNLEHKYPFYCATNFPIWRNFEHFQIYIHMSNNFEHELIQWIHTCIKMYIHICLAPCMPFADPTGTPMAPWMAYEEPCIFLIYIVHICIIHVSVDLIWFDLLCGILCDVILAS